MTGVVDDWPYPSPVFVPRDEEGPTWACPDLTCECHGGEEVAEDPFELVLFDHRGLRMPRARVRLHLNGRLLTSAPQEARGDGSIRFELPTAARRLFVEWAPAGLPLHPRLPYQVSYVLRVGRVFPRNFSERLINLGFAMAPLDEQVRAFQRVYELPVTGVPAHIEERLFRYYDQVSVDPVPPNGAPPPPDPSGTALSIVSAEGSQPRSAPRLLARSPAAPPSGTGLLNQTPPPAAPKPAAPLAPTVVRVQVSDNFGKRVRQAEVTVADTTRIESATTNVAGRADVSIKTAETTLRVTVSKKHHAPFPGNGQPVITGPVLLDVTIDQLVLADPQPSTPTTAVPGVTGSSPQTRRLQVVLIDGIFGLAQTFPSTPTRELTARESMREFLHHLHHGALALHPSEVLRVTHDPTSGDGEPCGDKCRLASKRLQTTTTIAGVRFLHLTAGTVKVHKPGTHVFEGQHHFEESFTCEDAPIGSLVLRNLVGMVRFARRMAGDHGIAVVYHIGFQRGTPGAHHDGRAIDVDGFAITVPELNGRTRIDPTRIGDDFHIALHWGRVHMWDPRTVAQHPNDSTQWIRLPIYDDRTDFPSFPVTERRLQYRLDPIPYPIPPPATPSGPADSRWLILRDHFERAREVFRTAYGFFVAEYTDSNAHLGPPPPANTPTPLDDRTGHFILHPDYGRINHGLTASGKKKQNGREAHFNHIHAQLGPT